MAEEVLCIPRHVCGRLLRDWLAQFVDAEKNSANAPLTLPRGLRQSPRLKQGFVENAGLPPPSPLIQRQASEPLLFDSQLLRE